MVNTRTGPKDEPMTVGLDAAWQGLNDALDPSLLSDGYYARGVNVRIATNGKVSTRGVAVNPVHYRPALAACAGAGVYDDANGDRWLMVADSQAIWMLRDGSAPVRLDLPAGVAVSTRCRFVQAAADRVYCLRGPDFDVLEWRGNRGDAWRVCGLTIDPDRAAYLDPVPRSSGGVAMADRLFVFAGDSVYWSDLLDYAWFDTVVANARFARGEASPITAIAPYQGNRLVVFKESATYFLNGVGGDMSTASVDRLPSEVGCVAQGSVAGVGNDLIWLGRGGVYRLSQTEQGLLRGDPLPLSADIAGTMERVNWDAAWQSTACVTTDAGSTTYRIALPLDEADAPNAVLVYDVTRAKWISEDYYGRLSVAAAAVLPVPPQATGSIQWWDPSGSTVSIGEEPELPGDVRVADMVPVNYAGRQVPALVSFSRILILDQPGLRDEYDGAQWLVPCRFTTRGYLLEAVEQKQVCEVTTAYATQDAVLEMSIVTDGVNERIDAASDRVRSRRRYATWARADFDVGNAGGDFLAPHREDYTVYLEDGCDFSRPGDGRVHLDLMVGWTDARVLRRRGRWVQVTVGAVRGRLQLDAVQVSARPPKRARFARN